jgi:hypothetical protein
MSYKCHNVARQAQVLPMILFSIRNCVVVCSYSYMLVYQCWTNEKTEYGVVIKITPSGLVPAIP